jgi:tagatose-6-phosphate ketose/aldose isomerase
MNGRSTRLQNRLTALLSLPESEKESRGLIDTPREIFQQPETWLTTLDRLSAARPALIEFLDSFLLADPNGQRPGIILTGAGTSDYIGRAVSRILRKQWSCEVSVVPSTELLTNMDDFVLPEKSYLLISFSRSGESSEGVAVLEHALERYPGQISNLVITCNEDGIMARFPGIFPVVLDPRVNDRGLAMTSSFTNMVIAGQSLAFVKAPDQFEGLVRTLAEIGSCRMAEAAEMTAGLAAKGFSRVCFLGTGALQAVADESSLKVLELNAGRIATVAQSALGLRHGPMSFVNDETLVVAFLSGEEQRQKYELDLLEEMQTKRLGAETFIVTPSTTGRIAGLTKNILDLQAPGDFPDFCRPAVDAIAGQLLGLFCAIENGITPDSPSTGAISRVISHVRIHSSANGKLL